MLHYRGFNSPGEFLRAARAAGISVPLAMMQGLTEAMRERGLGFPDAFDLLLRAGDIVPAGPHVYVYHLGEKWRMEPSAHGGSRPDGDAG